MLLLDFIPRDSLEALADILYTGKTSHGPQVKEDLGDFLAEDVQLALQEVKQEIIDRPDLSVEVKLNEYEVEESFVDDFSQEDFPYYDQTESFSNEHTKADQEQVHFDEDFEEDKPLKKAKKKKNLGQKSLEKVAFLDDSQAGNYKSFQCDFCPKLFPTKSLLTTHTRRHTGERPFSCKFCPKKFSQKGNRKSHEKKCKSKVWTTAQKNYVVFLHLKNDLYIDLMQ